MMSTCLSACTFGKTDYSNTDQTASSETGYSTVTEADTSNSIESTVASSQDTAREEEQYPTETETDEAQAVETETVTETETETVPPYVTEADSGEGYDHIILDRRFDLGFGCEWNFGKRYTLDSGLKQGSVTHYRDIGVPFYVLPLGLATQGEGEGGLIAASGLEDKVYWQFEEGYKTNFLDAEGNGPFELQDHRLVVNSTVVQNDESKLRIEQYNDYLHMTYPELYPESEPLLVKSVESNRNGKIVFSYNSYNDISNSAYATSAQFAEDTWPHLLLHQSFAEPVDLARYSSIEFSMTVKVNRRDQINTWPQGESDRYDQPLPPEGAAVSPSDSTLQTYFFIRSKKAPYTLGAFVGFLLSSSNESLRREHLGIEQNGIDFYRIDVGNQIGKKIGLEGEWLDVGDETTLKVDLIKYLNYVLVAKFENGNPDSKWYGVGVDDIYLSFFNVGYEYVGNWDCEYQLSNLWARGIIDPNASVPPEEEVYDGNWHLSVDEFEYGAGESDRIIAAATNNLVGSTITNGSGAHAEITAEYVHLKSGWIAVDGYEIENFLCRIYGSDGELLRSVSCGFYEVDDGVANHVTNNMGYGDGTSPHRFNGNPDIIRLDEFAGQRVTLVYEVGLVGTDHTVEMIELEVNVPSE